MGGVVACPPVLLLRRHVGSRDDGYSRINEEEGENLAVTGPCGVGEGKGADVVLEEVGEEDGAAGAGEDAADVLECVFLRTDGEDALNVEVVALGVVEVTAELVCISGGAEVEIAVGDVVAIVVEEGSGADVLVELALDVPGAAFVVGLFGGQVNVGELDYDLDAFCVVKEARGLDIIGGEL